MGVLMAASMWTALGTVESAGWPMVWESLYSALYFDFASIVGVEECIREVFGLLLWGYLYKFVGYVIRNCVY